MDKVAFLRFDVLLLHRSTSASSTTKIATRSEAAAINEEERVQQV